MVVLRFKKHSIPVLLRWKTGEVVKFGELKASKEYIYTLAPNGDYFIVVEAK